MGARACAVTAAAGLRVSAKARAGPTGTPACAVTTAGSADTLAISLFTRLRNSELNCAPGWEVVVGNVFDVRTDELFRSHAAKGHRWIWIIDFDHPADLSGHLRIPAQHRGLKRDNDIDVFRLVGDEHRTVRAQTVADDNGTRARRLTF